MRHFATRGKAAGRYSIHVLLLAAVSVFWLDVNAETAPEPDAPQSAPSVNALPDFPPLEEFDEIINRPLFYADRKPRQKDTGPTGIGGDEQKLRETWKLTGITITAELVMALFEERNGPKRLRLEEGMPLDEFWQLEKVEKDAVTLVSGDEIVRLELRQPREALSASPARANAPANKPPGNDAASSEGKRNSAQEPAPKGQKLQTM